MRALFLHPQYMFLLVALGWLFVALYLPRNKSLSQIAKAPSSIWPISILVGVLTLLAGIALWQIENGFLAAIVAFFLLAVALIILIVFGISELFLSGIPVAQEAGRGMDEEEKARVASFVKRHGRKIFREIFPPPPRQKRS